MPPGIQGRGPCRKMREGCLRPACGQGIQQHQQQQEPVGVNSVYTTYCTTTTYGTRRSSARTYRATSYRIDSRPPSRAANQSILATITRIPLSSSRPTRTSCHDTRRSSASGGIERPIRSSIHRPSHLVLLGSPLAFLLEPIGSFRSSYCCWSIRNGISPSEGLPKDKIGFMTLVSSSPLRVRRLFINKYHRRCSVRAML